MKRSRTELILRLAKKKMEVTIGNTEYDNNMTWSVLQEEEREREDFVSSWVQSISDPVANCNNSNNSCSEDDESADGPVYTELNPISFIKEASALDSVSNSLMENELNNEPRMLELYENDGGKNIENVADSPEDMMEVPTEEQRKTEETESMHVVEAASHDETDNVDVEQDAPPVIKITETKNKETDSFVPKLKKLKRNKINQRIQNKRLKYEGKCYKNRNNKEVEAKLVKAGCGEKCKLKCTRNILDEQRTILFNAYYALGDLQKQREFIKDSIEKHISDYPRTAVKKKTKKKKKRSTNLAYHFFIDGQKVRVCQKFYMATLDINVRVIQTVRGKIDCETSILQPDKRGFSSDNCKSIPAEIRQSIEAHIETLPRVDSHYCRKRASNVYIEGGKTLAELHRYYELSQSGKGEAAATYHQYRKIFQEYNLKFFKPKKDQCEDCVAYDLLPKEKAEEEETKRKHDDLLHQKELSREEKTKDKIDSPDSTVVCVYDLQATMNCPQGEASSFYYVSKLSVYNFTIVNLKNQKSSCFVWDETQGKRGAIEIGSCVLKFLQTLNDTTEHKLVDVIFYSDNCCGQQKNQFMKSVYHYAVQTLPKIDSICHKFLIKGHTRNEGDAVHSIIERKVSTHLKARPIYHPAQYITLIGIAKKKNPLDVIEMSFKDFVDIKSLKSGPKLKIQDVHVMLFNKKEPFAVKFKNRFGSEFEEICQKEENRKRKKEKQQRLHGAYSEPIPVPEKKKEMLLSLVKKGLIPQTYHTFYGGL